VTPTGTLGTPPTVHAVLRLEAHPNPFHSGQSASMSFELPVAARVRLTIHDVRGAAVATLIDGDRSPGAQLVTWNGLDAHGRVAEPGLYFAKLEALGAEGRIKIVRLR